MNIFKKPQFYAKSAIEGRANRLLMRMQATSNYQPEWPFDVSKVADFLDLSIVWEQISPDEQGAIAARIFPIDRLIEINENILEKPNGFEASTIAHEIGHWELHINQDEADGRIKQLELELHLQTNIKPFLCRNSIPQVTKVSNKTQTDWMEWQAQYFASCLLMPRYKLEELQQEYDLTNWRSLYQITEKLGVTISNLTHRLQEIEWIYIPKDSKQIYLGQTSSDEQRRLFG